MDQLFDVLQPALTAIVTALLAYGLQQLRLFIEKKTGAVTYTLIKEVVAGAVLSVEGLSRNGVVADKKVAALASIQATLDAQGIKFDVATLETELEAAVFEAFNHWRSLPIVEVPKE